MSYVFNMVVGSSGGGGGTGIPLVVTCTSAFSSATISCTDGITTLTAVCPSSSPYTVTFDLPNTGTWTISGTASGVLFSKTVTVTEYAATLESIPDGSTATPTDVIQTWLHCANIWDKNYTTTVEVLGDSTTLLALISDSNAVDYMVRSTTWASDICASSTAMTYIGADNYCADTLLSDSTWLTAICNSTYFESVLNVKVPTMTSDTAPSGQVIYSSQYGGSQAAFHVFDGSDTSYWFPSGGTGTNCYIGYKFTSLIKVRKWILLPYSCERPTTVKFQLQGSNDNTNWANIGNEQTANYTTGYNTADYVTANGIVNNTAYQYYRLKVTNGELHNSGVYSAKTSVIQFYGRA